MDIKYSADELKREDISTFVSKIEIINTLLQIVAPVVGIQMCRGILNRTSSVHSILKYIEISDDATLVALKGIQYLKMIDEDTGLGLVIGGFTAFISNLLDVYGTMSSPQLATHALISAALKSVMSKIKAITAERDYTDNIIKSMIDTLVVVNPDAMIKTVNQATLDLLGYKENELIGKPVGILFAEEEEEALFKGTKWEKLLKEGLIHDYNMTYKTKTGENIPVSFSGSVMYTPVIETRFFANAQNDR